MLINPKRRKLFLQVASVASANLLPSLGCSKQTLSPEWEERIAKFRGTILNSMQENKVPGVSIAILKNAKLAWTGGFGTKDQTIKSPVDKHTMFEAASMSKPVFAYAVLKLCERGVIGLDTPLVKYASEPFITGDRRINQITARHVLAHTTGFQDIRSGSNPLRIHFTPGEKWQYSGEGYAYLQSAITAATGHIDPTNCNTYEADLKVCGTDFDAFMKANLLTPFNMSQSAYVWRPEFAANMARPHDDEGRPLNPGKYTAPDAARYGSMGGLLTTASDYANFMLEVMAPKAADSYRLNQESLKEMLTPQVKVQSGPGYTISWALGWKIAQTDEFGELISHGGDQAGFHSLAEFSRVKKSGYIILTNGDKGWKLIQSVAPEMAKWIHA